jgi:hypothetical protein
MIRMPFSYSIHVPKIPEIKNYTIGHAGALMYRKHAHLHTVRKGEDDGEQAQGRSAGSHSKLLIENEKEDSHRKGAQYDDDESQAHGLTSAAATRDQTGARKSNDLNSSLPRMRAAYLWCWECYRECGW